MRQIIRDRSGATAVCRTIHTDGPGVVRSYTDLFPAPRLGLITPAEAAEDAAALELTPRLANPLAFDGDDAA